jgi:hypothetical protein
MNERGVQARPNIYRDILGTVIKTIRERNNVSQIRRFSVYFLHAVQEHMKHHRDQYYYMAKAARPVAKPAAGSPARNFQAHRPRSGSHHRHALGIEPRPAIAWRPATADSIPFTRFFHRHNPPRSFAL